LVPGIRDHGKTVLMTTHLMEEAERLCDRVAIIEHGKIIDVGSPGELVGRHCPARTVVLATDNALAGKQRLINKYQRGLWGWGRKSGKNQRKSNRGL
jgi:ABC-type multidrug transport system ATPase subunit